MRLRRFKNFDIIDSYLILSILLVYLIVPALFTFFIHEYYISAEIWLGLTLSSVVSILLISSVRTPVLKNNIFNNSKKLFSTKSLFVILIIFIIFELYKVFTQIDFIEISEKTRSELLYREEQSDVVQGRTFFQLFEYIFSIFLFIVYADIFHFERKRKGLLIFSLFFLLGLGAIINIFNSLYRSPIIFSLLYWAFFWHFYIYKIKFTKIKIFFLSLLIVLVFFYLSWSAYFREGSYYNNISILHGMGGLSTVIHIEDLKDGIDKGILNFEYGLQLIYNLFSWIPRTIWETKPFTSFSFRNSNILYGEARVDTWVRTFTIPGEGYLQFGIFGMVLWSAIFIYLYRLTKFISIIYPISFPIFLTIWVALPIIVRADLSSFFSRFWLNLIGLIICVTFLSLVKKIK